MYLIFKGHVLPHLKNTASHFKYAPFSCYVIDSIFKICISALIAFFNTCCKCKLDRTTLTLKTTQKLERCANSFGPMRFKLLRGLGCNIREQKREFRSWCIFMIELTRNCTWARSRRRFAIFKFGAHSLGGLLFRKTLFRVSPGRIHHWSPKWILIHGIALTFQWLIKL